MISGDYPIKQCSRMLESIGLEKINLPYRFLPEYLVEKYGETPEFYFYTSGVILCRYENHRAIDFAKVERDVFWSRKVSVVCSYIYTEHQRRILQRSKIPKLIKIYSKFYGINPVPPKAISS